MKITSRITLGLALAAGLSTAVSAHELVDWADIKAALEDHHCEAETTRADLLRGLDDRREGQAERDQGARADLKDQLSARKTERTIERLKAENAKMRDVLTALGVDVDKALAGGR